MRTFGYMITALVSAVIIDSSLLVYANASGHYFRAGCIAGGGSLSVSFLILGFMKRDKI